MPEDISEDMPDRMPDRMPEDMSEYMPEDMPDRMPEDMSDRMPEDMPDRMPEDLPDRMPEDMPDRMPNRMSQDMSDRMPEDVPVRTCINVMVGITRSKVFFLMSLQRIKSDLHKLPMLSQQRFASPHSQKHILPTLVALRPDPAAESCVDPQTVDNCVGVQ